MSYKLEMHLGLDSGDLVSVESMHVDGVRLEITYPDGQVKAAVWLNSQQALDLVYMLTRALDHQGETSSAKL